MAPRRLKNLTVDAVWVVNSDGEGEVDGGHSDEIGRASANVSALRRPKSSRWGEPPGGGVTHPNFGPPTCSGRN